MRKPQTVLYRIWADMKQRCSNPKRREFPRYGGRGIFVCSRWLNSPDVFAKDMGERPSPKHSLDRKNNDGPYSPSNCRWATRKEQMRNRNCNHLLTFRGKTLTVAEWAERSGLKVNTITKRLRLGWSLENTLQHPSRGKSEVLEMFLGKERSLTEIASLMGVSRNAIYCLRRLGKSVAEIEAFYKVKPPILGRKKNVRRN